MKSFRDKIIVALDYPDEKKALDMVKRLNKFAGVYKVGFELFVSAGPSIVREINNLGGKVFLDLKLHDIPNTVEKAALAIKSMNVFMFNVHASGGFEMMKRTAESLSGNQGIVQSRSGSKGAVGSLSGNQGIAPLVVGVTVLTSLNSKILNEELGINSDAKEQVIKLAKLAKSAGLDGVVASGEEIIGIKKECGNNFIVVVPGVRPDWVKDKDDQKRVITPKQAIQSGADFIVVGRPITKADNPEEAAEKILKEIS